MRGVLKNKGKDVYKIALKTSNLLGDCLIPDLIIDEAKLKDFQL